jgi:hypothetical protein
MNAEAASLGTAPPERPRPGTKKRRHSGTADWHMSRQAVSLALDDVSKMPDAEVHDFFVKARFGSWDTVCCAHCGSIGRHYWRPKDTRWKCFGCDKTFSVTSGTPLSHRKRPLRSILTSALLWMNSSAGQPALELKRHRGSTYNAEYVLQQKLREALVRGYNVGLLAGDLEMDGAHQSGWRAAEKRGKPQGSAAAAITPDTPKEDLDAAMLTHSAKQKARQTRPSGAMDPEFGRRLPKDRRLVIAICQRSGVKGMGTIRSRVAVALAEDKTVAGAVAHNFVSAPESCLNTDTSPAYDELGKRFREHRTVEHSKELVGPNGENNNLAESYNARMDRCEKGVHLNIEPKYMLDYAVEMAFRTDTRRLPNGEQLKSALSILMSVGPSLWWRGFSQGRHRTEELTSPTPRPAPSSGPPKGRHPSSVANGRPPR